jgi:vitamin B12 transporter
LYRDYYGYARRKEGNEILDGGASFSLVRELPGFAQLAAAGSFYAADKHIPFSGYTAQYAAQNDRAAHAHLMLDMPRAFNDNLSMELSVSGNWKDLSYDPGYDASLHTEHTVTLINRWGWYPSAQFTFRLGGDYSFARLSSTNTNVRYGNRGGLYVTSEYIPTKSVLLVASIKGITDGRDIVPVPTFGIAWSVTDRVTLTHNYFRSYKFPDFNDLYWVQSGFIGNPHLKNEDGWGTDIRAQVTPNAAAAINTTLYGQWITNSIHWNNASGTWRPENSGTGAFAGWDTKVIVTLPFSVGVLEKPVLRFSWALQLSWLLSGGLSFADDVRIPYMPIHTLGAALELPWKTAAQKRSGSLLVSARFESTRYADTANVTELAPNTILTIIYNQAIHTHCTLFAKIDNALNAHYVSFADYPMPGISVTLGVTMRLGGQSY